MKTSKHIISLLMFFYILSFPLKAQYKGKPFVMNFDVKEYRTNDQNWSININENGLVYIGNNKGLLEFDGSNWNLFPMPENMVVRSVATEGDDIVYVGAFEEFGVFKKDNKGRMNYHSLSDTLNKKYFHNDEIWRIIQHNQKVYFQSFSNIYVYIGQNI